MSEFAVVDLNTTEWFSTIEEARACAEAWHDEQVKICEKADDEELMRWYRTPQAPYGLDNGDIEIWQCPDGCEGWWEGTCVICYSGRKATEAEVVRRGLLSSNEEEA